VELGVVEIAVPFLDPDAVVEHHGDLREMSANAAVGVEVKALRNSVGTGS
jgi:hypothetical protein